MKICIAETPSYAYAAKGRKLLVSRGYPCEIKRVVGSSKEGCGYSLRVGGDCEEVARVLDLGGVPYKKLSAGGDPYAR